MKENKQTLTRTNKHFVANRVDCEQNECNVIRAQTDYVWSLWSNWLNSILQHSPQSCPWSFPQYARIHYAPYVVLLTLKAIFRTSCSTSFFYCTSRETKTTHEPISNASYWKIAILFFDVALHNKKPNKRVYLITLICLQLCPFVNVCVL